MLRVRRARDQVAGFADTFPVYDTTPEAVVEAARGMGLYELTYCDAPVWALARVNDIPVVLSEDFAHGTVIEVVRFENPFLEQPCD